MSLKHFNFFKSLISIIILLILLFPQKSNINEHINDTHPIFEQITTKLSFQKQIDENLNSELKNKNYTLENPLVVLDPYNESPLTALLLFNTNQPSKIAITIVDFKNNEDKDISSSHKFSEYSTEHIIPIYGLFPNTQNTVIIEQFSDDDILLATNNITIQTEKLPTRLDNLIILTETYSDNYHDGLNYHFSDRFAFDKNGTIRWFLSNQYFSDATYYNYSTNRFIFPLYTNEDVGTIICEMDKLGKIYNVYYVPFIVHHDITILPNGNLLALSNNGETVMDFAFELDVSSGKIINTMDFKKVLQRTRLCMGLPDWLHANSITYDENDETILISSNAQSTIAKIKWPEGKIKWILSSPIEYLPRLQKYLLTPINEDFEYSYNQHDVNILPDYDNNPDTIDISVFDNGVERPGIAKSDKYSRLVHYRINEKDMTVKQIWQFGKDQRSDLFAFNRSSFKMLPNGNRLGLFCVSPNETTTDTASVDRIVEIDQNSNLIWNAEVFSKSATGNVHGYQAYRLPFYSSNELEHDITFNVRNLIPQNS